MQADQTVFVFPCLTHVTRHSTLWVHPRGHQRGSVAKTIRDQTVRILLNCAFAVLNRELVSALCVKSLKDGLSLKRMLNTPI